MEKVQENGAATHLTIENGAIVTKKVRAKKSLPLEKATATEAISNISPEPSLTPALAANTVIFFEFFNLEYAQSLAKNVLTPIEKYYFRAEFVGFTGEEFPQRNDPKRPLIFASNHSGMAFPWDAVIFAAGLLRRNQFDMSRAVRALASPLLSRSTLMNPFLIKNFWKRAGGIDATTLNFETMMHFSEANILIYPEGIEGIGKGFDKKYQIQRLSTSALRMSLKYRTDIIPFATVNAEYVNPFSYSIDWLNDVVRQVGIPFLPIGITTLLILAQPWMFYFGFPAKLVFVRGRRIKPYEMLNKPFEEITREDLYYLRDRIHWMMQTELDQAVKEYGQQPYDWTNFLNTLRQNWRKAIYFSPLAWPFLFVEHERRWQSIQKQLAQYASPNPENEQKRQEISKSIDFEQDEEDETIFSLVQTAYDMVSHNLKVLTMYIPIAGWIPTLLNGYSKD
ncbi:MAG: glycerol acyltransferase [Microscillaceae bacterium]|jgi:hypothetical protein|nr:glycerol acyltransferase [Microscillaceae bacterium]